MEALIIAAGRGSRMSQSLGPKPLVQARGKALLENVIGIARSAGIKTFKIVVGYEAERIKNAIGDGQNLEVSIEYIHNPDWERGNGISVYSAREKIENRFILLMSDHLFDPLILTNLLAKQSQIESCTLCVDYKLGGAHIDHQDATKVLVEDHKIIRIGKGLDRYNAIDTGIFLMSSLVFEALEQSISQGKTALTDANQILSDSGRLAAFDIGDRFWLDIDEADILEKVGMIPY